MFNFCILSLQHILNVVTAPLVTPVSVGIDPVTKVTSLQIASGASRFPPQTLLLNCYKTKHCKHAFKFLVTNNAASESESVTVHVDHGDDVPVDHFSHVRQVRVSKDLEKIKKCHNSAETNCLKINVSKIFKVFSLESS